LPWVIFALHGSKSTLYLRTELQKTSKIQHNKTEKESHILLSYQSDSLQVFVKMKREITGVLSKKELKMCALAMKFLFQKN
tara:strand:- start:58524 stop:58766 length:243 start_codon:yes stop_codon:yes gene_type:complete